MHYLNVQLMKNQMKDFKIFFIYEVKLKRQFDKSRNKQELKQISRAHDLFWFLIFIPIQFNADN